MTQKEFIEVLEEKGYSYEIEGDNIVVTHKSWYINLGALTSLPPGVEFRNGGDVDLRALTSLPSDVVFRNKGDVYLPSLIRCKFFDKWEGNIEGVGSKRLLNLMISKGMFI
jgi:hypothetical protein